MEFNDTDCTAELTGDIIVSEEALSNCFEKCMVRVLDTVFFSTECVTRKR